MEVDTKIKYREKLIRVLNEACSEATQQGYEEGYIAGQQSCNSAGDTKNEIDAALKELWECVKKIVINPSRGGLTVPELENIFNTSSLTKIFNDYNTSEVVDRIKKYVKEQEKKEEIKVGDEIVFNNTHKAVVIEKSSDKNSDYSYRIMDVDFVWSTWVKKDGLVKTGRTFPQMAELVKQLKGGSNGET